MPEPTLLDDKNLPLSELQDAINAAEEFAASQNARVFALIQGKEPHANANKIVYENVPPPAKAAQLVLREFKAGINENELLDAVADFEQEKRLRVRRISPAWVEGEIRVVAIFEPAPAQAAQPAGTKIVTGNMSVFGGVDDEGMTPTENLALVWDEPTAANYPNWFFTKAEKPHLPGYGRRLKPGLHYVATRWKYTETPKSFLQKPTTTCTVFNPTTGKKLEGVRPIDWGPNLDTTGRDVDLSPAVAEALGLDTDDICTVWIPLPPGGTVLADATSATPAAPGKRRIVWLTGDYSERKVDAGKEKCDYTIDFHFNGFDKPAFGGEVFFKPGDASAKTLAEKIFAAFSAAGIKPHGEPIKSAGPDSRAKYIAGYPCHSVLLEPLFLTEKSQAEFIRKEGKLEEISKGIANAIKSVTGEDEIIGLSVGHLGKTSQPNDRGVQGFFGDWEGDYNKRMAEAVARHLQTA